MNSGRAGGVGLFARSGLGVRGGGFAGTGVARPGLFPAPGGEC